MRTEIALAALLLSACAHVEPGRGRVLSVSGTGDVEAAPDMASVTTGVVSEAQTAAAAMDANSAAMREVMARLRAAGIAERDLMTSNLVVTPVYTPHEPGAREAPRIAGYRVTNSVTARVRELSKLGAVIDAAIQAGANEVSGVSFSIADPEPLLERARRAAVEDAFRRAETYAAAAGVKRGRVLELSEAGAEPPQPMHMRMMSAEAGGPPIAPGEQTISAIVTILFSIE